MTETWSDYGYWTDFLSGRPRRKVANNTYARLEPDGRIVILYHTTDILTFFPNDEVEYQSGGWLTYTTKDRFNRFGAHGVRISQDRGRWYVHGNRDGSYGRISDYYDGMRVKRTGDTVGMASEARASEDPDKKIKRDIDRYVKLYTDERIAELVAQARTAQEQGRRLGDCWYCLLRTTDGRTMGEIGPDHSHLLDHIEEGYTMVSTALNAVAAAGYRNPPVILMMGNGELTRRCLKRYLRQRLATNTAGAAGGPKPIASGF